MPYDDRANLENAQFYHISAPYGRVEGDASRDIASDIKELGRRARDGDRKVESSKIIRY